ncbi:MAG: outer membrane protein assembly factor BamA [Cocleimonas sp.]
MKKQIIQSSIAGCIFALSHGAWADSFILTDVQVSGLERITAGTVLSNVPVSVGEKFDDSMTANLVRSLYKTGFFEDVNVSRRGNVLLVKVKERAAIGNITVEGNKAIKTPDLMEALKRAGVAKGRPLDKSALNKIEREIKQQYLSNGNYSVGVSTKTEQLARNRVALTINISEGAVARIKRVNISGNKAYPEATLKKLLESSPKGRFSFFGSKDKYAKEKLVGDIDKLSSFYRDRGYLNFEVVSTQVSLSKDKNSVFVNININEGDQYRVGKVKVSGNSGLSEKEIAKLVTLKEGQIFSQTQLSTMRNNITSRLGKDGFSYSRIGVSPQIDNVNKRVNLLLKAEKGQRTYVRRINIRGNFRTKDEVFRREMRQLESSFLSKDKVDQSKKRIQRLPFVESVKINTSPVAGRSDQVDLDVIVSEQSSNQFNAGLGYSQSNGLLFNVGVAQNNFLGTGKSLSVSGERSDSTNSFRLSYNNPYHTVDGVGRGFNVFYTETDAEEDDVSDYSSSAYGGDINYTIPLTEENSLRFSLGVEHREITTSVTTPTDILDFVAKYGDTYDNILGKISYIHDTRDRFLFPTEGVRHNISLEVGLPGSDLEYYKLDYKGSSYFPVSEKVTFALKGRVATGEGFGDTDDLPFFERFYSGGISSVRGFENNSLGPRDSNGDSAGGDFVVNAKAELLFPVPFAGDVKGLRMSAFVDAGNVFEDYDDFDGDQIRYSAGLSATWISPLGPFTLSYAKTLNAEDGDEEQKVQFTIGTSF